MLPIAFVMSDYKELTTYCPKLDLIHLKSDTPKTKKKQGTSATQIIFNLKMNRETLVPIKTDSDLEKKSRKNTNKFNFEKTCFWCPMLHILTVHSGIP